MTQDTKYNGWTNYETWCCNLHYDCFWQDAASECLDSVEATQVFTREENAVQLLATNIKDDIEEFAEQANTHNDFFNDLLNSSLREINYHEIAKHYIDEITT